MPTDARRIEATVLMCDVRGFTTLFDEADPMLAFDFAAMVLQTLSSVVEACGGSVDKFTGDGLLAHFGVINADPLHAIHACECALRLKRAETDINSRRYSASQQVVSVGIGINTGEVVAGTIVTSMRSEFTIYGDTVNTASRIESLTRYFHVDCLTSETTRRAAADPV